jgi:hypothetical protein
MVGLAVTKDFSKYQAELDLAVEGFVAKLDLAVLIYRKARKERVSFASRLKNR